jgi:hypothetical protein
METELAKNLMELFFHAPAVNGILVFEDNDYLGVILKRDIEIGVMEGNFNLFENINFMKLAQLPPVLFKNEGLKNIKIPVVDKTGNLIRIISYEEFLSQFFFDEFINHFKTENVLDHLEHPVVITNHFKKTVYLNKSALELIERDILGKNLSIFLKTFDIKMDGEQMFLKKKDHEYRLVISSSSSKNFSFFVYQFFKIL